MEIRTAESELDAIYGFYKDITENYSNCAYAIGRVGHFRDQISIIDENGNKLNELFTNYLMDLRGMNSFPLVVPDDKYQKHGGIEVYRGELSYEYAKKLADNWTYHYGTGNFGEGIYTTNSQRRAFYFSKGIGKDDSYVYKFKINENTKILDYESYNNLIEYFQYNTRRWGKRKAQISGFDDEVLMKLDALIDFVNEKKDKNFTAKFVKGKHKLQSNALAVYLGFDAIEVDDDYFISDFVVLNRGALILSESEKDRIIKLQEQNELKER